MPKKESKGKRQYCTLSEETIAYLDALAETGLYGPTTPRVMAALIEEGIRNAVSKGFVKLRS